MRGGVFISYRREGSAASARLIRNGLARSLGSENIFFDVDSTPLGTDFTETLNQRLAVCHALIAVIGKDWTSTTDQENRRRIDNPSDYVRVEIETALMRSIPVIPTLVQGAPMPRPEDLPETLKKLTDMQGLELSDSNFNSDIKRLINGVRAIMTDYASRAGEKRTVQAASNAIESTPELIVTDEPRSFGDPPNHVSSHTGLVLARRPSARNLLKGAVFLFLLAIACLAGIKLPRSDVFNLIQSVIESSAGADVIEGVSILRHVRVP